MIEYRLKPEFDMLLRLALVLSPGCRVPGVHTPIRPRVEIDGGRVRRHLVTEARLVTTVARTPRG